MDEPHGQPNCDIGTAFPRVPEDHLQGLSYRDPVTNLTESSDAGVVYESIADWMLRHPSACIGTILLGLWLAREDDIESPPLPTRVVNALARLSITVWGEVVEWTPSFLLDIRGFGGGQPPGLFGRRRQGRGRSVRPPTAPGHAAHARFP